MRSRRCGRGQQLPASSPSSSHPPGQLHDSALLLCELESPVRRGSFSTVLLPNRSPLLEWMALNRNARNFRYSAPASFVPGQLKNASILPVPKIPSPLNLVDYRPISITPVLCRTLERIVDLMSESFCTLLSSTHPHRCHLLINTLSVLLGPPLLCSLLYYRQSVIS